jgi:transcriptional regulator with XRE-family HTH domain
VTLGDRLLTYRLVAGLTQEELAARVGAVRIPVYFYEKGWFRPSGRALRRLAGVQGPGLLGGG